MIPTFKQWLARRPSGRKPRKPIPRVSKKHAPQLRQYRQLAATFKREHPVCEANLPGCTKRTQDVHHTKQRGPYLCSTETFLGVCRSCHDWIHSHPQSARELGLLT